MSHRSPARYLALVAVLAAGLAVYLVVHSGLQDDSPAAPTTAITKTAEPARHRSTKRTYTVRTGDTLSAIAERTGIALTRLQRLNPDVDANTLRAGQRLKLRASS